MPLVGKDFAYPEIETALNLDFSSDRFISTSFIDNTGERSPWSAELKAFGEDSGKFPDGSWPPYIRQPDWNPKTFLGNGNLVYGSLVRSRANLIWWPFEGMSVSDDPKVFLHSPGWDFAGCVEYLYSLYTDSKEPATVLYVHCMLGADRTGALHAGLLVRVGVEVEEALKMVAAATPAGAPSSDYQRLVRAYASDRTVEEIS